MTVNAVTSPTTNVVSTTKKSTQNQSDKVDKLIKQLGSLNTDSKEISKTLKSLDGTTLSPLELMDVQLAFSDRQRLSDMLSNVMRSMHEMSMNVVRNMKLN